MPATTPIDFAALESALYGWFYDCVDIATVWANQDAPQPDYPFAHLILSPITDVGPRELRYADTSGTPAAGEEIEFNVVQQHEVTLSCTVHVVPEKVGSQPLPLNPATYAKAKASAARASLNLPSVKETLCSAGLTVRRIEPLIDISAVIGPDYVDRATFDVVLGLSSCITERTTYIETVETEGTFTTSGGDTFIQSETIVGP